MFQSKYKPEGRKKSASSHFPVATRKARIAFVAVSFMRSGTEQVILDLAAHFVRAGHEVFILIPRLPALDGMVREARRLGAIVESVGPLHSAGHNALRNGLELFHIFRRLRPNIVHFHVPWEPICFESVVAAIAGIPVRIRTEHNPALQRLGLKQRLKMHMIDWTFQRVVYLSEGNRQSHVTNLGRDALRSILIGNGVQVGSVGLDWGIGHRREVRKQLNLPLEAELAVMVGTIEERKGPLDFVRAAAVAAALRPNLHFAILGDGPLRSDCEQLAADLGISDRMHFLGRQPQARNLLSAFDLYVQASHFEGMSVAMLEALIMGLPMVTTRVDGVEDVLPNETGALYVDIGDWLHLGQAMAQLAADAGLRGRLAAYAQARVRSEFTVDSMCDKYAGLYRHFGATA